MFRYRRGVLGSGLALRAAKRAFVLPPVESVPVGRVVELPGRGSTFVVDVPGPEGAPTVVLLHALSCTAYLSWFPVLAELSQTYRVIAFDQRWHGRGIRSSAFRLTDCADDVAAVLDAAGVDSAVVCGYSMGGAIAQLTWLRQAERVQGLVLAATSRNFRGTRLEKVFFPAVSVALTPLSGYAARRVRRFGDLLPALPGTVVSHDDWGRAEFRSTSAWSAPAVLNELGRFNSASWIGEVDVPTSVIVSTRDRTIPVPRQRRLAESVPGAEVFEVDGGHAVLVLGAERFSPVLHDALASVVRRASLPVASA